MGGRGGVLLGSAQAERADSGNGVTDSVLRLVEPSQRVLERRLDADRCLLLEQLGDHAEPDVDVLGRSHAEGRLDAQVEARVLTRRVAVRGALGLGERHGARVVVAVLDGQILAGDWRRALEEADQLRIELSLADPLSPHVSDLVAGDELPAPVAHEPVAALEDAR